MPFVVTNSFLFRSGNLSYLADSISQQIVVEYCLKDLEALSPHMLVLLQASRSISKSSRCRASLTDTLRRRGKAWANLSSAAGCCTGCPTGTKWSEHQAGLRISTMRIYEI